MLKLYILVRNDLSKSQQAVQAGHALAEYLIKKPDTQWDNGTLVYLKVRNKQELLKWYSKLDCIGFREPDKNNELTALATLSRGQELTTLRLL